jgi:cyclophilin family peptidyl-prolyl cis-trans isomerase
MKKIAFLSFILIFMMNVASNGQGATAGQKQVKFVIHTEFGDMKGVLYNETPKHRDNFVKLVKSGFYDGLLFHRVIMGFMIQGGDPQSKNAKPGQQLGNGGPGYTIPAEFNADLKHKRGALAAARLGDQGNPTKASSGSQFYIVQPEKGAHFLDMNYTVYGEITEGFDVIDKIASAPKDQSDRPLKDIKMAIKILE